MKKHIISVILLLSIIISTTAPISYASSSLTVKDVSSGGFFNAVILSDDSLWMWGEWFYIGPEPQGDGSIPEKIMTDVKDVSCGRAHTMILKNNGDLYVMGLYGGKGLSDIVGSDSCLTVPTKIMSNVKYIDAGGGESCAVTTDGSLYVWHDDFEGNATTKPEKVMSSVVSATVGEGYWLAVKNDNTLWACGENSYGQLGDGTTENKEAPVKIMDNVKFVDTAYWGWSSTAAIKTDSTLWTWGLNRHGQLGNNGYYDKQIEMFDIFGNLYDIYDIVISPKKILDNVKTVNSAPQYMCAVLENGNLYEWGCLEWPDATKTPVYVMNNVRYAENANSNGIALRNNNTSWVWGRYSVLHGGAYDVPVQYDVLNAKSTTPTPGISNNNTVTSTVIRYPTVIKEESNKIVFDSSNNMYDSDNVTWENKEVTVSTEHHSHGDVTVKNSKLKITDSGQHIIKGTLTIDDGGELELTGKLVVTNLIIKGSGKITVGDTLAYCNPVIDIKNDFTISSNHDENVFKKGKMYIGGNFTQKEGKEGFLFWNSSRRNFECESGFEVIFFKGKDNPGTTNISFESGKSYFNDVIYDEELEKITYKVDGKTITTGKKSCIKGKEYYAEVNVSPLIISFLQSYTYTQSYGTKIIATEKIIDIAKDCADKLEKTLNRSVLEGLFSKNKSVNADQLEKVIESCVTSKRLLEYATYDEANINELFGTVNVKVGGQKISIRIEGVGTLNNSATFGKVSVKKVKKGDENTSYQLAGIYTTVNSDEFIDAMMKYGQDELKRMINTCYSGLPGEKVVEKLTNDLMEDYCNAVIEATYGKPASALYSTKSRAMLLSAMGSEEFIEDENLRNCIAETLNIDADAITADDMSDIIELDISGKDIRTLSGLEYATNLTSLNAENNNITDISPVSYLPIEKLLLGNNRISEFAFYNSSLLGVDLHRNNLNSLDVSACTNLQELNVESNLLTTTDVENIKTNTTLEYLAIGNNDIDNIDFISYLTGIKVLNLNELYLADVDMLNISGLSELYSLALSYNCIEDLSFMEELYNIELLDISHTQVKDLSVLNQLYYLKNLNVSGLYYLNDESTELLNTLETNGIIIQQISFDKSIQYMSIPEEIVIGIGDTFVVSPVIMPLFADEDVLWSTTDENIATINEDGTIVAVGQGECDVVAAAEGNALSVVCKVRVADKHEMLSVNVDENVVTIALHSINNDDLNNESNIVLVYYKGNMMTHCEIVADVSDMISGAAEDVECTIPNGITYDTIKLFVLRSATSLKPICTYKKINIY